MALTNAFSSGAPVQGIEAFTMVSTFGIIGATIVSVARSFFNRASRRPPPASLVEPALQERLDRLEGAIQAIAVETERIAEGQRFTTRLLSQHGAPTVQPLRTASPPLATQALPAPGGVELREAR